MRPDLLAAIALQMIEAESDPSRRSHGAGEEKLGGGVLGTGDGDGVGEQELAGKLIAGLHGSEREEGLASKLTAGPPGEAEEQNLAEELLAGLRGGAGGDEESAAGTLAQEAFGAAGRVRGQEEGELGATLERAVGGEERLSVGVAEALDGLRKRAAGDEGGRGVLERILARLMNRTQEEDEEGARREQEQEMEVPPRRGDGDVDGQVLGQEGWRGRSAQGRRLMSSSNGFGNFQLEIVSASCD